MKQRVYIASKMTGIKAFNFPSFDAMRVLLTQNGFDVVSPADIDRAYGFDGCTWLIGHPDWDFTKLPEGLNYDEIMKRDIDALSTCQHILLFGDWISSKGANIEKENAEKLGLRVWTMDKLDELCKLSQTQEIRVIDEKTGGQKGSKLARFDLIPCQPLWLLAEHYGKGANKYSDDNWRKGYSWRLSFSALQRHLQQFWNGENIDDETGSQHLIAAAWHCFTMSYFLTNSVGTDDRPKIINTNK